MVLPQAHVSGPRWLYVGLGVGGVAGHGRIGRPAALAGVVVGLADARRTDPRRRGSVPEDADRSARPRGASAAAVDELRDRFRCSRSRTPGSACRRARLTDALHSPVSVGIVVGRIVGTDRGDRARRLGRDPAGGRRLPRGDEVRARGGRGGRAPPSRSRCPCSWPTWRSWTGPRSSARRRSASWRARRSPGALGIPAPAGRRRVATLRRTSWRAAEQALSRSGRRRSPGIGRSAPTPPPSCASSGSGGRRGEPAELQELVAVRDRLAAPAPEREPDAEVVRQVAVGYGTR